MLVGAGVGCGDDTTTSMTGNDMAVGNDLSMPVMHDMKQLNCAQIFQCAIAGGGTAGAAATCIAEGTTASKQAAGALEQCAAAACADDGGVNLQCAGQTIAAALGLTGGAPSGACMSQGSACLSAM